MRRAINGIDYHTYKPIADYIVANLGLQSVTIKYRFAPYVFGGMHTKRPEYHYHLIQISTNLGDNGIRYNLAHELRHAWQTENKKLTWEYDKDAKDWMKVWNGKERIPNTYVRSLFGNGSTANSAYEHLPWEKDANDYARSMLDTLRLIAKRS